MESWGRENRTLPPICAENPVFFRKSSFWNCRLVLGKGEFEGRLEDSLRNNLRGTHERRFNELKLMALYRCMVQHLLSYPCGLCFFGHVFAEGFKDRRRPWQVGRFQQLLVKW